MAQIAAVSATDNLFIYNPKSFTVNKNSEKGDRIKTELESEIDFIESTTAFLYNSRVCLNIRTDRQGAHFVLLKGLIEFYRSKNFVFTFDRNERSIEVDIRESEFAPLKTFLAEVNQWYQQEIRFKSALKNAISFEARYKAERESLYATLLK
jgi:hypothetical protein